MYQVVDNTEKVPLGVDLILSAQGEFVQPENGSNVGKEQFAHCESHTIDGPADCRVDLSFHPLCKSLHSLGSPS